MLRLKPGQIELLVIVQGVNHIARYNGTKWECSQEWISLALTGLTGLLGEQIPASEPNRAKALGELFADLFAPGRTANQYLSMRLVGFGAAPPLRPGVVA